MAIFVTDLGTASGSTGASLTMAASGAVAGSMIFVAVYERNNVNIPGAVQDGAGNVYNLLFNGSPNNGTGLGVVQTYYAFNTAATSSITYTRQTSDTTVVMTALSATGLLLTDPQDPRSQNARIGLAASPSLNTAGGTTLAVSGELVIGVIGWNFTAGDVYGQDTTNGFAFPPDTVSNGQAFLGGGYLIRQGNAQVTYNPTTPSREYVMVIQSFMPAPEQSHEDANFYAVVA